MSEQQLRVLLVDDEWSLREPLAKHLRDTHGYHVDTAADTEEAWRLVTEAERPYDVALIDDLLTPRPGAEPEPVGIELMGRIRECYPETECIIFTGWGMERALEALQAGAYRYLAKPLNLDELGMTIRMAAEQARLRRERDLLSATLEISKAMVSGLDIERILAVIAEAVPRLVGAEACAVARVDPVTGKVQPESPVLLGNVSVRWHRHLQGVPLTQQIVETGEPFVLLDVDAEADRVDKNLRRAGVKSFIGVPIPGQAQNLGVLYAYSTRRGAFGTHEQRVLQLLAGQAAIALENAQLFEAEARRRREAETLRETALALTTTLEQQEIFERILSELQKVVPYDSASVQLFKGDWLEIIAGRGFPNLSEILGARFPVDGDNPNREVMRKRAPLIVSDAQAEYPGFSQKPLVQADIHGWLGVPMLIGDRLIGMIALDKHELGFYGEEHTRLAQTFAAQASVAIENARLFQEREFLLDTSKVVSSAQDLDQSLQTLAERLVNSLVVTFCRISLLDDTGRILTTRAAYPIVGDLAWNPGIGQQYPLSEAPDEAKAIETGQRQILWQEENPGLLSSLERKTGFQGVLKTAALVPLTVGGKVFGVITLGERRSWERGSFVLERVALCESAADQVAALILRIRLQEQAERNLDNIRRLYEASSRIGSTLEPDQTMRFIVEKACQAVEGWRATSVLLDESGRPHGLSAVGFDKKLAAATSIRTDGISTEVVKTGDPYLIEDVKTQANKVNPAMIEDGVRAAICLPLRLGESSIGVLWIHYKEPQQFLPAQIEALKLYATQAAIAYDNARRMQELEHLRLAAEKLASVASVQEVLQQIVRSAREVLGADSSVIWSYDDVRYAFFPDELVADGIGPESVERFREEEPRPGGTAEAVMRQKYLAVTDIDDPKYTFLGLTARGLQGSLGARAFQGIALQVGGETLGVLYVNYKQPGSFSDEDRATLEIFAYHAALTLKRARLLEQVSKARDTAKVVAEVSVLEDLRSTLNSIARGTQDALDCDAVTLYTHDQIRDEFGFPPAMVGVRDTGEVLKFGLVARGSVTRKILALDAAHVAEDAPSDPLMSGAFVKREEVKSSVGIPLKVGDRKVGVMFVNYRSHHRFTADELINIELFANQAAVAIRNAQLYQAEQRYGQALRAIQTTSAAVSAVLELDILLPMITEEAAEIFGTPATSLMLWDERQENLIIRAAFGLSDEYRRRQRIARTEVDELITRKRLGPQVYDVHHKPIGEPELVESEGLYTVLATPLIIASELIGVLNIYSKEEPRRFEEKEKELATIFANQAAIAIQNARAYEELRRTKGLVGARTSLAWMGMASSTWRHAMEGHALTIREQAQLLRRDLQRSLTDAGYARMDKRLDMIERLTTRILDKPLTPPLAAEEGVALVVVNELIGERAKQLWQNEPYKNAELNLNLRLNKAATVRASPEWLRRAFDVLVDNAIEAVADCEVQEITIGTRQARGGAEIVVSDTGPGMSREVMSKLFFEPIQKPKEAKGLGVGLLMAQAIIQTYGGDIRVESTGPTGTTVVIWLPLAT